MTIFASDGSPNCALLCATWVPLPPTELYLRSGSEIECVQWKFKLQQLLEYVVTGIYTLEMFVKFVGQGLFRRHGILVTAC